MIKVNDLKFGYNGSNILDGLSLEVNEGEIFTILGPNGSGKTTFLKCIERILVPKSGTIEISGKDLNEYSIKELGKVVSSVPQLHRLTFPFTVLDFVLMGRNPYLDFFSLPSKDDLEIALEALNDVGIAHLRDSPYTNISGGELRLTLIARVLAQRTPVVILDEPTAFLDFKNEYIILSKIRELKMKKGLTIVLTLHDPNLAMRFSDRVMMLSDGKILSIGTPTEVLTQDNIKLLYGVETEKMESEGNSYFFPKEF
ncbi:MAG: ABC transporter ATP-binding protein [Caldisericaceae bacterium]